MKLRSILAGTAIASLALFGTAAITPALNVVAPAQAAVSVSFSVFYDQLASHGDWVRYHDTYVFIPGDVGADWRPYTEGHWAHTKRYGWMWISDEPFGWATYHYGRWGYGQDIGWYWVPGKRWAPAWVSWRRSKDYIVWAPLPPSRDDSDVSVSIHVGDIPEFYWVAVPSRRFLAPDVHVAVIREDRQIRQVIDRTEYIGAPRITNNIVINNVLDVNVVQQVTGEKVRTVKLRETNDPRQATAKGDQVTVFQGDVTADQSAKPKDVREVTEVKKVKRGGETPNQTGTNTGTTTTQTKPADKQPDQAATPQTGTTKEDKNAKGDNAVKQTAPADQAAVPQPDMTKPDKKKVKGNAAADQNAPADHGATPQQDVTKPDKRKMKDNAAADQNAPADQAATPDTNLPPKKKVKGNASNKQKTPADTAEQPATPDQKPTAKSQNQTPTDVTGTTEAAPNPNGKAKGKDKAQSKKKDKQQPSACDPSTDPNCQAQQ